MYVTDLKTLFAAHRENTHWNRILCIFFNFSPCNQIKLINTLYRTLQILRIYPFRKLPVYQSVMENSYNISPLITHNHLISINL